MKKLSLLLPLVILSACTMDENNDQVADAANQVPTNFSCEQGGVINANYSADGETAYLQITIPQANVNQASLELNRAVSGSGERYVNDTNPDEVYEWQTKANDGVFAITQKAGKRYTMVCQAS